MKYFVLYQVKWLDTFWQCIYSSFIFYSNECENLHLTSYKLYYEARNIDVLMSKDKRTYMVILQFKRNSRENMFASDI